MMTSHRNGLKLDYVRMTYEEQFDKQLNHASFGYKLLEDFLYQCPDVVNIEQRNSGLWVEPVSSRRQRQGKGATS